MTYSVPESDRELRDQFRKRLSYLGFGALSAGLWISPHDLRDEVGAVFFPWTLANAQAIAAGAKQFSCTIDGRPFAQEAQKYHAKSLGWLGERYAKVADRSRLDPILERAGCLAPLRARL